LGGQRTQIEAAILLLLCHYSGYRQAIQIK
jgi:hypothetical protein